MDKKKTSKGTDSTKEPNHKIGRRKAVRNMLAASGLVVGAPIAGHKLKVSISKKVTPAAYAKTLAEGVILVGHVNLEPVDNLDDSIISQISKASALDFFINASHAAMAPNLAGAHMVMNVSDENVFSLDVEFPDSQTINILGTISNDLIKGSGYGVAVSGIVDLTAETPMAVGALSNGADVFDFSLKMAALEQCEYPDESTTYPNSSSSYWSGGSSSYWSGGSSSYSSGSSSLPPPP